MDAYYLSLWRVLLIHWGDTQWVEGMGEFLRHLAVACRCSIAAAASRFCARVAKWDPRWSWKIIESGLQWACSMVWITRRRSFPCQFFRNIWPHLCSKICAKGTGMSGRSHRKLKRSLCHCALCETWRLHYWKTGKTLYFLQLCSWCFGRGFGFLTFRGLIWAQ